MNKSYSFTNVNHALPQLATTVLAEGDEVGSRLGERTLELTHVGIKLEKPWQREIVIPGRKASVAAQIAETMWVLSGRNDIGWLSHYLPRASDFSDDGSTWRSGYGPRLRDYGWEREIDAKGVDQLARVVELLQRSPGTRQGVISIWDPTVDGTPGKDTACNNWLSFISRKGKLDLHVAIRSNDLIWGWSGINQFEWSALQEIVAGLTGLMVGELHFTITSLHVYDRHWEKARLIGLGGSELGQGDSPRFDYVKTMPELDNMIKEWFGQEALIRTGQPIDVGRFPEPMMRSWLRVLQWYWSGDERFLESLNGTRLRHAALIGSKPAGKPQEVRELPHLKSLMGALGIAGTPVLPVAAQLVEHELIPLTDQTFKPDFLTYINELHAEKHAAYGDSWKRRGEFGILANIARKVDRLIMGLDTSDETQLDTAIDLLVYLAKYRGWLVDGNGDPMRVAEILSQYDGQTHDHNVATIAENFEHLTQCEATDQKTFLVDALLGQAYSLARSRW